ncbi:MAG: hypothetical protein ACTJIB_12805 [Pseudoalteromonas prydzensis]|jgi:hypothetical protein|uniref:hypothetical protein n=1 Tax=Pseudoalteromonas prydzensis TaxID=182141 RepID=UPI003F964E5F
MLPVNLSQLISRTTSHTILWEGVFEACLNAPQGQLIKQCNESDVISMIKAVEGLVVDFNADLIALFDVKVRKHPFTTAFMPFPVLSTQKFMQYLSAQGVIKSASTDIIDASDDYEFDLANNTVSHTKGAKNDTPIGAYLAIEFSDNVKKVWFFNDVELHEAHKEWGTKVLGGAKVFSSMSEWVTFALMLRALKTFDVYQAVMEHAHANVFKTRVSAYYASYFQAYKDALSNRFAGSVTLSRFVTTEGSQIESALQDMEDVIPQAKNVILLNQANVKKRTVTNSVDSDSCYLDSSDDEGDDSEDYSDLGFGVI